MEDCLYVCLSQILLDTHKRVYVIAALQIIHHIA
jgi:hypothetical protein